MPAWALTAAWTAIGLILWVMFPMTTTVLLPLCCIAPAAWHWAARGRVPHYPPSRMTAAFAAAGLYLLVNASWSLSLGSAVRAVAVVFVMIAALHVVLNTLPDLDDAPLRAMAAGALAGLMLAAGIICLEVFSDQSLRRFLMHLLPALQPGGQHLAMEGGQLARLAAYLPNASVSVLAMMFWPAALIASRLGLLRTHRSGALLAGAVVAATIFASEHATSQVAFVGAGAAFVLFRARPKLAAPLVIACWVAANLLVVPAASVLYGAEAYRTAWLPHSARHRIVIWGYTAEQIPKAPLLGAGIGTARALHDARAAEPSLAPGTSFHLSTSLHSHNAYLQVWYETGAAGALLMLGLGLLILRALLTFPADARAYLMAAFVACALGVASAYSIWAPWFMASLAMAAMFAALGAALPRRDPTRLLAGGEAERPTLRGM
jgi:O-antigen ligase